MESIYFRGRPVICLFYAVPESPTPLTDNYILVVSSDCVYRHNISISLTLFHLTCISSHSTLGHSTKAIQRASTGVRRGSRTSTVDVKTVARHRIRPSPF